MSGEITNATSLDVGVYELQLNATDSEGNVLSLTITVEDTVSPEIDTSPDDIEYTEGTTGHTVIWIMIDLDPGNYTVYIDEALVTTDTWTSLLPVIIVVDGLAEGIHNVELRFFDKSGNMATSSVTVTVNPSLSTTVTTTTTTSVTTTTTPSVTPPAEGTPMILLIIGAGVSGVILVVLGVAILRKRAT